MISPQSEQVARPKAPPLSDEREAPFLLESLRPIVSQA